VCAESLIGMQAEGRCDGVMQERRVSAVCSVRERRQAGVEWARGLVGWAWLGSSGVGLACRLPPAACSRAAAAPSWDEGSRQLLQPAELPAELPAESTARRATLPPYLYLYLYLSPLICHRPAPASPRHAGPAQTCRSLILECA
jgi:hypothetical protein